MTNTEKICQEIKRQMSLWWDKLPDADKDAATWTQDEVKALGEYMAYENLLDFIDSLPKETPETLNGKFVFPKFLYARTTDNKTIDVSYAPQSLDAIEYIRSDYLQQEQPEVDLENHISNKLRELGDDLINNKLFAYTRGLNVGRANAYKDILNRLNARKEE